MRGVTGALLVLALASADAAAQSVLDRPPNLGGTWVGNPNTLHFNFLHRFTVSAAPQRKVTNAPTFLMAYGLPARLLVGARYATSSQLAPGVPNEWEFFGRYNPIAEVRGSPLDLSLHAGYNQAVESFDAEISASKRIGRLTLLASGRMLSSAFGRDTLRGAVAGGATFRLGRFVALAGDVATLFSRREGEDVAWGAGLQLQIPYSPHTLSLQATNTNSGTVQGSSVGAGRTRYGFEFTIPITLARYFGGRVAEAPPATTAPVGGPGQTVRVAVRTLAYQTPTLVVAAGTTVVWENQDPVDHTVTADDGRFDSGLITPNQTWSRTFDAAGTYTYHCAPHPFMKGTVVVR